MTDIIRAKNRTAVHPLAIIFDGKFFVDFRMLQHGAVEHVFEAGLKMAD